MMNFRATLLCVSAVLLSAAAPSAAAENFIPGKTGAGLFKTEKNEAQPLVPAPSVRVRIEAEKTRAEPGKPLSAAVILTHSDGWHTYWKNPGSIGVPPEFEWSLPKGWKAGAAQFPNPVRPAEKTSDTYTVSGTAYYPVSISVPKNASGEARLSVKVSWLACKDICVPGEAEAELTISAGKGGTDSGAAPAIRSALASEPGSAPAGISSAITDGKLSVTLPEGYSKFELFPAEEGQVFASSGTPAVSNGRETRVYETLAPVRTSSPFVIRAVKDGKSVSFSGELAPDGAAATETESPAASETVSQANAEKLISEASAATPAETDEVSRLTLLTAALFAFLGGLILNLMPCVFPVLSLKMLGLVEASNEKRLLPHGIAFTAGVLLSMFALSGTLIALQAAGSSVGWGFQLQSPGIVLLLALLFTAITLNLLGVYEFTFGSRTTGKLAFMAPSIGITGSFFTGILAVVVASPCTAPFMGAALGFALSQPAAVSLPVFLSLGLGMSAPWLLLTVFPGWGRLLPKPGAWMNTLKKVMALPVALTLPWLFWVLYQQLSAKGFCLAVASAVLMAAALYSFGRKQFGKAPGVSPLAATLCAAAALVMVASGSFTPQTIQSETASGWQVWSPEAVAEATAARRPVFVNFTAAWCVTCQMNKKAVIETDEITKTFSRLGYTRFIADWTNRNPLIAEELKRYRHNGVPLYLVITRKGEVTVLPELLTREILAEALEKSAQ